MSDGSPHDGMDAAEGTEASDRRVARPARWMILSALVVLVTAGGIWLVVAWSGRGAQEASLQDAIESAREDGVGEGEPEPAELFPATGVYTYEATGREELSLLGTAQDWGSTIPATVSTSGERCWEHRMDYSTSHWASQVFCPEGQKLMEHSGVVFQSFDFVATRVDEETQFDCDPPSATIDLSAAPGDSWPSSCAGVSAARGTSTLSEGRNAFVGPELLDVDGEEVPALRYRLDRTISGDQQGTNRVESWFHAETGLLLKGTREVEVASPSPIGDIVYSESGSFEITSLTPEK